MKNYYPLYCYGEHPNFMINNGQLKWCENKVFERFVTPGLTWARHCPICKASWLEEGYWL